MAEHGRFRYKTLADLQAAIAAVGVDVRVQEDLSPLARRVRLGRHTLSNSLGVHPMEGCDGEADGSPGELTFRRYRRFGAGGAGLLWFEATAVVPDGRANPRQLCIHRGNRDAFARLLEEAQRAARQANGPAHEPFSVLQLTHSGRYSRPTDRPQPVIAYHCPVLDPKGRIAPEHPVISDDELEALEDRYVEAARLAWQAGFRAVDIKHCHRYLLSELLAAHTRPGRYGGPFENRTRFLFNVIDKIRDRVGPDLVVTTRMNAYDALPYPYGWGVDADDFRRPDLREPIRLVRQLAARGVPLVNISIANPYYNPHYGRPFDEPIFGAYVPDEHPVEGVARMFAITREIQRAVPGIAVVGTGYSWLRQFLGHAAAANIANGWVTIAGVGREAFAYPNFARDLLRNGVMDDKVTCITCSNCTQIMRDEGMTGCVPRDQEVYLSIYREGRRRDTSPRPPRRVAGHL